MFLRYLPRITGWQIPTQQLTLYELHQCIDMRLGRIQCRDIFIAFTAGLHKIPAVFLADLFDRFQAIG